MDGRTLKQSLGRRWKKIFSVRYAHPGVKKKHQGNTIRHRVRATDAGQYPVFERNTGYSKERFARQGLNMHHFFPDLGNAAVIKTGVDRPQIICNGSIRAIQKRKFMIADHDQSTGKKIVIMDRL